MLEEQDTIEDSGNAVKTSVSLPPYLSDWLSDVVRKRKFPSKSNAMQTALAEMKGRMDAQEEMKKIPDQNTDFQKILEVYFKTPEGKLFLENISSTLTPKNNIRKNKDDTVLFSEDIPRKLRLD